MSGYLRLAANIALLLFVYGACATGAHAQEETPSAEQEQQAPSSQDQDMDALAVPLQQYNDPEGRFSLMAPANWGRLAAASTEEVTFQGPTGDSMRISVAPLEVDRQAFLRQYVDTYMKVLAQSFSEVKYVGERTIQLSSRQAVDHVFTALHRGTPVTCHQVIVLGQDKVLYITFAGFGASREHSEQLFLTALSSFWVSPSLGLATMGGLADPHAPAFVLPIPEGWVEYDRPDPNSYVFRPPNSRPMSAFVSASVTKAGADYPYSVVDDAFAEAYGQRIASAYPAAAFEMRAKRRITLGGEPAVRFDYAYISNLGVRRAVMVMCLRKGYILGINCDAVEQGYLVYERAFENLVTSFRFK